MMRPEQRLTIYWYATFDVLLPGLCLVIAFLDWKMAILSYIMVGHGLLDLLWLWFRFDFCIIDYHWLKGNWKFPLGTTTLHLIAQQALLQTLAFSLFYAIDKARGK